jgi:hypothetical protein
MSRARTVANYGDGVEAADLSSTLDLSGKTVTLPSGVGGKIVNAVSGDVGGISSSGSEFGGSYTSYTATGMTFSINKTISNSIITGVITLFYNYDFTHSYAQSFHDVYLQNTSDSVLAGFDNDSNYGVYCFMNDGSSHRFDNYMQLTVPLKDSTTSTGTRTYEWYTKTNSSSNIRGGKISYTLFEVAP